MTHIDDWVGCPGVDPYAAAMFAIFRLPAVEMLRVKQHLIGDKRLFCDWQGKRYRVTGASRMGDVWLTSDFSQDCGYEHRVNVDDCSRWGGRP